MLGSKLSVVILVAILFTTVSFTVPAADSQTAEEKALAFLVHLNAKSYKKAARLFGHPYNIASKKFKKLFKIAVKDLKIIRRTFGKITGIDKAKLPNDRMQITGLSLAEPQYVMDSAPNKQLVYRGISDKKDKIYVKFQFKTEGTENALLLVLISYS